VALPHAGRQRWKRAGIACCSCPRHRCFPQRYTVGSAHKPPCAKWCFRSAVQTAFFSAILLHPSPSPSASRHPLALACPRPPPCRSKVPKKVTTCTFTPDGAHVLAADKFGDVLAAATLPPAGAPPPCPPCSAGAALPHALLPNCQCTLVHTCTHTHAHTHTRCIQSTRELACPSACTPPRTRAGLASEQSQEPQLLLGHFCAILTSLSLSAGGRFLATTDRCGLQQPVVLEAGVVAGGEAGVRGAESGEGRLVGLEVAHHVPMAAAARRLPAQQPPPPSLHCTAPPRQLPSSALQKTRMRHPHTCALTQSSLPLSLPHVCVRRGAAGTTACE
jgi:hypothetical protein